MKFYLTLNIPREEIMRYYKEGVQTVHAKTEDGKVIQFPISVVRSYIKQSGVQGRFVIECDQQGKLIAFNADS